jgi:hypothetical protein
MKQTNQRPLMAGGRKRGKTVQDERVNKVNNPLSRENLYVADAMRKE